MGVRWCPRGTRIPGAQLREGRDAPTGVALGRLRGHPSAVKSAFRPVDGCQPLPPVLPMMIDDDLELSRNFPARSTPCSKLARGTPASDPIRRAYRLWILAEGCAPWKCPELEGDGGPGRQIAPAVDGPAPDHHRLASEARRRMFHGSLGTRFIVVPPACRTTTKDSSNFNG
jgi:hypothetical protein